jgi:hypothetical protein
VIRWVSRAQPVAAQCTLESGAEVANKEALLGDLPKAAAADGRKEA